MHTTSPQNPGRESVKPSKMTADTTQMRREFCEVPTAVERLLDRGESAVATAVAQAHDLNPPFLLSVAHGSSDHACTYLKFAGELLLNRPMASIGPSVASQNGVELDANGTVCISNSQSGQNPDIVQLTKALRKSGEVTIAINNNPESCLARAVDHALPNHAGPELSVAATKTFVSSLVADLWLIAELERQASLLSALRALPEHLDDATGCDWSPVESVIDERSLLTLGRGPSRAISNEAALKFKETCLIHAESHSSAEVLHGPVSIVDHGFPVIAFVAGDAAEGSVAGTADVLADKGARVFVLSDRGRKATRLQNVRTGHWLTDAIAAIMSFYCMVEALAVRRGVDPDTPWHLNKVIETV